MRGSLAEWREQIQSLPLWQRALYIIAIYIVAVTVVAQTHGIVAAVVSASAALLLAYLLANHDSDPLSNPRQFVDIQFPTLSHVHFALGGITAILAVEIGLGLARAALSPGSDMASHDIVGTAATQPDMSTVALIALAVIVVGPLIEELAFRNGIQKALTPRVGAPLAIGLTSAIFAVLHVPSYGGFDAPITTLSLPLTGIFASSCIFGVVYHRTENVLAAFMAHGGMNALALVAVLS